MDFISVGFFASRKQGVLLQYWCYNPWLEHMHIYEDRGCVPGRFFMFHTLQSM